MSSGGRGSGTNQRSYALIVTAKRHRVDVDKVRKAVEQEFTAKCARREIKQNKAAKKGTTKTAA